MPKVGAEEDLLEFGAGNKGYPGAEVDVTAHVAPGGYSGIERQQCVTIGAPTRGSNFSREVPEKSGIIGASVRSPEGTGGEVDCLLYTSDAADE